MFGRKTTDVGQKEKMDEQQQLSANTETTLIIIKPEELADEGRAEEIFDFIAEYCLANGLQFEARYGVFDRETLERHYFGRGDGYVEKVGANISRTMIEHEIPFDSPRNAAVRLLRVHIDAYEGKPFVAILVTGPGAIAKISKIKGNTDTTKADPETVRGRFDRGKGIHEYLKEMSPVPNIIHIPETPEEVEHDIRNIWNGSCISPNDAELFVLARH